LKGLFRFALVSKGTARSALPLLYAIASKDSGRIKAFLSLWRSIIASSLGATLFPYCCWLKSLKLNILHRNLERLARDRDSTISRAQFFAPPLEKLEIVLGPDQHSMLTLW
jgi:hypothetical protein